MTSPLPGTGTSRESLPTTAPSLAHVRWIAGGTGSGKSTLARLLAARHGIAVYDGDLAEHRWLTRCTPEHHPYLSALRGLPPGAMWDGRTADEVLRAMPGMHGETVDFVVDDLLTVPTDRIVLVDYFGILPGDLAPLLSRSGQAVFLLPTARFRAGRAPRALRGSAARASHVGQRRSLDGARQAARAGCPLGRGSPRPGRRPPARRPGGRRRRSGDRPGRPGGRPLRPGSRSVAATRPGRRHRAPGAGTRQYRRTAAMWSREASSPDGTNCTRAPVSRARSTISSTMSSRTSAPPSSVGTRWLSVTRTGCQ